MVLKKDILLLVCFLSLMIGVKWPLIYGQAGLMEEYCNSQPFNPVCSEDQVIVIQSAFYGIMRKGKCIDADSQYIGCSSNELDHLDKQCSGKQQCNIIVGDASMKASINCSIPKLYTRYLEARYTCLKTYQIPEVCDSQKIIQLKSGRSVFASKTTKETGCGEETKPYIVQAKQGQKINVTMIDFNWNPIHQNIKGCVMRYGYIIDVDVNQVTDICGKTSKNKHILISEGSSLQIVLDKNILQETRFVFNIEVIGCPTFESPPDTWTKEDNGVVTVGCVHNDNKWKMRCIGNHWIGILGKCEKVAAGITHVTVPDANNKILGMSPVVTFVLIGGVFLIIVCVLVTTAIGYFCIKKPNTKQMKSEYYLTPNAPNNMMFPLVEGYPTMMSSHRLPDNQTMIRNGNNTLLHENIMMENDHLLQNNTAPHYFVLEKRKEEAKEPIYDAVYQNA